eukprot:1210908-Amphidinium_carterae.1
MAGWAQLHIRAWNIHYRSWPLLGSVQIKVERQEGRGGHATARDKLIGMKLKSQICSACRTLSARSRLP